MLSAMDAAQECLPPGYKIGGILADGKGWFEGEVEGADVLVQTEGSKVTVTWDHCYGNFGNGENVACNEIEIELAEPDGLDQLRKALRCALNL
jgi:hypothetical protein